MSPVSQIVNKAS